MFQQKKKNSGPFNTLAYNPLFDLPYNIQPSTRCFDGKLKP